MDEIFEKMSEMLHLSFEQGAAYQRMTDAGDEFNKAGAKLQELWFEVRGTLEPQEGEEIQ